MCVSNIVGPTIMLVGPTIMIVGPTIMLSIVLILFGTDEARLFVAVGTGKTCLFQLVRKLLQCRRVNNVVTISVSL